jgi:hypothetical protein
MPTVVTTISSTAVSASTARLKSMLKFPAGTHSYSEKWRPSSPNALTKSVW